MPSGYWLTVRQLSRPVVVRSGAGRSQLESRMKQKAILRKWILLTMAVLVTSGMAEEAVVKAPYVIVLGIAQDGGVPQAGTDHQGWEDPQRQRLATSLGLVDPATGERWLFEATPDFPEQLHRLDVAAPVGEGYGIDGIFLTHAHIGHYAGLMHLGHEVMGADNIPVYAMPRMAEYLRSDGPWSQLVNYQNIDLREMADGESVQLNDRLRVTPFRVPHRQEYSEVVGYRIEGPHKSVLFIPDIDSWEDFDAAGTRIEDLIAEVDHAYLDATFFDHSELPGRDMSGFPHPPISHSMRRFAELPAAEKAKVRFIHLNHTNPALWSENEQFREVLDKGFVLAMEGEKIVL